MKNSILILIIINIINIINGQSTLTLIDKDFQCMNALTQKTYKINDQTFIDNKDQVTGFYNYCNIPAIKCNTLISTTNTYISFLNLTNINGATAVFNYTDFGCFTNLDYLELKNYQILSDKLFQLDESSKGVARSVTLNSCFSWEYPKFYNNPIKIVSYNLVNTPIISNKFYQSSLINLTSLTFTANPIPPTVPELIFDNTLALINLKTFSLITDLVPNLINFNLSTFDLTLVTGTTGYSNFNSFNNIQQLTISSADAIDLPIILTVDNNIEKFKYTGKLNTPTAVVNITPSKKLKEFYYYQSPTSNPYAIAGAFPLVLPLSITNFYFPNVQNSVLLDYNSLPNLKSLYLWANQLSGTLPELSINSKLVNLDLSENQLSGTLPNSYCSTMVNVGSNSLINGVLPECFRCYFQKQTSILNPLFSGTGIDTTSTTSTTCTLKAIPNFSFDQPSGIFKIWGENIGYALPSSTPSLGSNVTVEIPNKLITGFINLPAGLLLPPTIQFDFMGLNYTIASYPKQPIFKNISIPSLTSYEYTFEGSYFTYNTSDISIVIGGYNCKVSNSTFSIIICNTVSTSDIPTLIPNNGRSVYRVDIKISTFTDQLSVNPNLLLNPVNYCPNQCVHGYCITSDNIGVCSCDTGFFGSDCSSAPTQCLNNCTDSSHGTCNLETGVCSCGGDWAGYDCGIPYKECYEGCNDGASLLNTCDTTKGICTCSPDYTGPTCLYPSQYVSSIDPSTTNGGIVNMYGWFGLNNTGLNVIIGTLNCKVEIVNSSFLNCTIGPDSGTKSVTIIQNGIKWIGKDIYHYTDITYPCPNSCSSHGVCNSKIGQCKCNSNWGGYDCSSIISSTTTTSTTTTTTSTTSNTTPTPTAQIIIPPTETTINTTKGSAILSNQQTSFEIMIKSLVEIDFNGNIVVEHKLQQNWDSVVPSDTTIDNIYIFKQSLINNTDCIIQYTIEELNQDRNYTFADLELTLESGSIKISVIISNYTYLNSLNTLQLQMESKIGDIQPINKDVSGKCNEKETTIDQSLLDKNQLLNYLTISKDSKKLYSRFINRVISDGKPTFITTSIIVQNDNSTVVIGLNLPHSKFNVEIDPDFSVLVQNNYKSTCGNEGSNDNGSGRASWVLPVAIVVPCVVVVSIIIIGAFVYSKNRTSILLAKERVSFKLGKLSKKDKDGLYIPNN